MSTGLQTTKKYVKQYLAGFKIKVINVEKITDHTIYNKVRNIMDVLEKYPTNIPDVRDEEYGKQHLVMGVKHLQNRSPQAIIPSRDFEAPRLDPNRKFLQQQNYIQRWNYYQTGYLDDKNVQEAGGNSF